MKHSTWHVWWLLCTISNLRDDVETPRCLNCSHPGWGKRPTKVDIFEVNVATFTIAHCLVQILENIKWNSVRYCWWELLRTEIILSGSKPSGNLGSATCTRTTSRTTRGTSTSVSFTIIQHRNTSDELPGDINSGGAGFIGGPNVVTVMGADFCVEGEDIFWYYYYYYYYYY